MAIEKCYWQQYILSGISGEPWHRKKQKKREESEEKKKFISFFSVSSGFGVTVVVAVVAMIAAHNAMIPNHKFMRYETVALVWI